MQGHGFRLDSPQHADQTRIINFKSLERRMFARFQGILNSAYLKTRNVLTLVEPDTM